MKISSNEGKVGIFWFIQWQNSLKLLSASCLLSKGEIYGDMITYGDGHYLIWDRWRKHKSQRLLRAITNVFEYEEWPRGRVSYCLTTSKFHVLCDRKIMRANLLKPVMEKFAISSEQVTVGSDPHYQSVENLY